MIDAGWKFKRTRDFAPESGKTYFVVAHVGWGWDCSYATWSDTGWLSVGDKPSLLADALEKEELGEEQIGCGVYDGFRDSENTYWADSEAFGEFDEALDHFKNFTPCPNFVQRASNVLKAAVRAYNGFLFHHAL